MMFKDIYNNYKRPLQVFFEGRIYPFIVALLILISHVTALELYLSIPLCLMASAALIVCESIKSFFPIMLMFLYMINRKHSPGVPNWSDYYQNGFRLGIIIFFLSILGLCFVYYIIKNIIPKARRGAPPMLITLTVLSVAFTANGMFSTYWSAGSLLYGLAQVLIYFLLFYVIYYGIEDEDTNDLISYLTYLSLLVAMVLIGETAFVFLTYENIFAEGGSIVKEEIMLGWGAGNPLGFSLGIIIPLLMRGAMKEKHWYIYFGSSVICWVCALLTQSRNALIFATAVLGVSILAACFVGERRRLFRFFTLGCVAVAALGVVVLFGKISSLFKDILNRGMADNGRYRLWSIGIENFKTSPLFGTGFFGYNDYITYISADFLPTMAHNTVIQLLSSMGIVGFIAYLAYRVRMLIPFLRKMTADKFMLLLTVLYVVGASMFDNFVFYIYTMFLYTIVIALATRIYEKQKVDEIL